MSDPFLVVGGVETPVTLARVVDGVEVPVSVAPVVDGEEVYKPGGDSLPEGYYFTDFSDAPVGEGPPPGWTSRWVEPSYWSIGEDEGTRGGKVLNFAPGSRRFLTWDLVDEDPERADVEVLMRVKSDTMLAVFIWLRAVGELNNRQAALVRGGVSSNNLFFAYQVEGVDNLANRGFLRTTVGEWVMLRVGVQGEEVRLKIWEAKNPEPANWNSVMVLTAVVDPGWVGVGSTHSEPASVDWVSVATGGRTALMPDEF